MRTKFATCVFDRDRRELTRDGAVVHAGPKLLKFLEILLDAHPRALTKEDIHKGVWPDTFVSDGTLTSLVAELRDAIGDDARAPRLVRTIHGYGYAFVADVSIEGAQVPVSELGVCCRILFGSREVGLPAGQHILGRTTDVAVFVDDAGVSRHHARITVGSTGAVIEDLGSKNGTLVNGHRIEAPTELSDGASIVLGATSLTFRLFTATGSTATVG